MELWIRSQKNNKIRPILIKVESLELGDDLEGMDCIVANNLYNLGTYESKERTLEVLNEIQRLIEDLQYIGYAIANEEFCAYRPNVYNMPEE